MKRPALPRWFRVASFRLAAFYASVFAASTCVLGLAVFIEARSALREQLRARIETETAFLTTEIRSGGLARLLAVVQTRGRGASALDYLVQDAQGRHLAGEIPAQPGLAAGWVTLDVPQASEDNDRSERVRALVSDLDGGIVVAVGGDLRQFHELEAAIATAFLTASVLVAALGIGGGYLLSRAFLRQVDEISRTAEAIIEGDLSRRVPSRDTGDDLDRLAATLNHMLDRITQLMESLRQVSSDVAHDLRTPLTRLFHRLEGARLHAGSISEYAATVDAAIADTQGLLDTFAALLRIAEVEGAPRGAFSEVDLANLVETVADAYVPDAEASGHTISLDVQGRARIEGDKDLLTQALSNLIENALRHTPGGTRIQIRLAGDAACGVMLDVRDDGPGVPEADLPRLTHRFYRGEHSRTAPGNGLGLSLVGAVAALHGADLAIRSANPGLGVLIRFAPAEATRASPDRAKPRVWHAGGNPA